MKLLHLAAVVALWSAAAFGQVTLQCPACSGPIFYSAALNSDSVARGVILNNASTKAVPVTWSISGPGFIPGGGFTCKAGSLAPGKCVISVKYHPSVAAFPPINATGTLTVIVGTPSVTTVVSLIGNTTNPPPPVVAATLTPTALDFGPVTVGTCSASKAATLTSTGKSPLTVTSVFTFSNNQFSFGGSGTCSVGQVLNPGQSCTGSVKFCPTAVGSASGVLNYNDSAPNSPQALTLTSIGIAPAPKSVQLNWNAPVSDGAASYNLYRASTSGGMIKIGNVVGSVLTFTDVAVPSGTYQYAARTVDNSGRESVNSNQVVVTIP
jgi:hypothetical protein